jgi:hypothetical protein
MKSGLLCHPPEPINFTQPLDVAIWWNTLKTWEGTSESTMCGIVNKDVFLSLEAANDQTFGIQE